MDLIFTRGGRTRCLRACFDDMVGSATVLTLVLRLLANFTEGGDSVRLAGAIAADRCTETRSAHSTAQPITEEFGGRVSESETWRLTSAVSRLADTESKPT